MGLTAIQIDFLLSGSTLTDGSANANGKVYFFSPGTTTTLAVYSDKAKTAYDTVAAGATDPHTGEEYVKLDSGGKPVAEAGGRAEVYGDNTYDVLIYDENDSLIDTLSSVSYVVVPTSVRVGSQHSTGPVTVDSSTNAYYFDTTGGNISADLDFDASSVDAGHNVTFVIISGTNNVIITPNSGSIAGEATWTIGGAGAACRIESDGANDKWGIVNVSTHTHADIENGGNALIIPTIADFTNAAHTHADVSGAGTALTNSVITGATIDETSVQTHNEDSATASSIAVGSVNMGDLYYVALSRDYVQNGVAEIELAISIGGTCTAVFLNSLSKASIFFTLDAATGANELTQQVTGIVKITNGGTFTPGLQESVYGNAPTTSNTEIQAIKLGAYT